jgi:hypothetical protein
MLEIRSKTMLLFNLLRIFAKKSFPLSKFIEVPSSIWCAYAYMVQINPLGGRSILKKTLHVIILMVSFLPFVAKAATPSEERETKEVRGGFDAPQSRIIKIEQENKDLLGEGKEKKDESDDELTPFVRAPLTQLAINNIIWTVSIANLNTWRLDKPLEIEKDVHSAVIFEGRGDINKFMEASKESFKQYSISQGVTEKNFEEFMSTNLPKSPQYDLDEDGTWMLGIDLRVAGSTEETTNYIFGKKKGQVCFLNTESVKKRTLSSHFLLNKDTLKVGNYEVLRSFQLLAGDAMKGINEAYFNQTNITYSRAGGATPIISQLHCASFAESILRCCGFFDTGGLLVADRELLGSGNFMSLSASPSLLRSHHFAGYWYRSLDKESWKKIIPILKEQQILMHPTVCGLDLMDRRDKDESTIESTRRTCVIL